MPLRKQGEYDVGDSHADIAESLKAYAQSNKYPLHHWRNVKCECGCIEFQLMLDEGEGVAIRKCEDCDAEHFMGDSEDFIEEALPDQPECVCEGFVFEVTAGVSLYRDSNDVRWLYIGCRCINCGITGCYADWKNEYPNYKEFLDRM